MNGRLQVSGARTMSCSKVSSMASFWEMVAQWRMLRSSLRPLTAAFRVFITFGHSGRTGLVIIIGRPMAVAAAIVFDSSIQRAASLREKYLISSTVRSISRHQASDSPSGFSWTWAGLISRWRSPYFFDRPSSSTIGVVRSSDAWIDASLMRWSGASGAIGLVHVMPPAVADRSTTSTSRPALAR